MKKSLKHNRYIIGLALVALAAASIPSGSKAVSASGDGSVRFVSYASIGIAPEQVLRVSVGNPTNPRTAGRQLTFEVTVYGGLCPGSCAGEAPIKMLRTGTGGAVAPYDVPYNELGVEGEPGTGRVQMWVQIIIEAPSGSEPIDIPVWLDIINQRTGATTVLTANRIWEYTPCCDPTY
ncbi:MAG TPA: hypothetical protein VKC34_02050 [Blastocatellia bacterium]|nr:hypothetical protein [Blastocatellia bacterium]